MFYTKFEYTGPVTSYGKLISERWSGETMAKSSIQAKNQLKWKYKKQHGMNPYANIELPAPLKYDDEEEIN